MSDEIRVNLQTIASFLGDKMPAVLRDSETILLKDLWTGEEKTVCGGSVCINGICAHERFLHFYLKNFKGDADIEDISVPVN